MNRNGLVEWHVQHRAFEQEMRIKSVDVQVEIFSAFGGSELPLLAPASGSSFTPYTGTIPNPPTAGLQQISLPRPARPTAVFP